MGVGGVGGDQGVGEVVAFQEGAGEDDFTFAGEDGFLVDDEVALDVVEGDLGLLGAAFFFSRAAEDFAVDGEAGVSAGDAVGCQPGFDGSGEFVGFDLLEQIAEGVGTGDQIASAQAVSTGQTFAFALAQLLCPAGDGGDGGVAGQQAGQQDGDQGDEGIGLTRSFAGVGDVLVDDGEEAGPTRVRRGIKELVRQRDGNGSFVRVRRAGSQSLAGSSGQFFDEIAFDDAVPAVVIGRACKALGRTNLLPATGFITGAQIAISFDKRLDQFNGMTIDGLPVAAQTLEA